MKKLMMMAATVAAMGMTAQAKVNYFAVPNEFQGKPLYVWRYYADCGWYRASKVHDMYYQPYYGAPYAPDIWFDEGSQKLAFVLHVSDDPNDNRMVAACIVTKAWCDAQPDGEMVTFVNITEAGAIAARAEFRRSVPWMAGTAVIVK